MSSQKVDKEIIEIAKEIEKNLRVNRINPNNIQSVFVNDLVITHNKETFFLTFSESENVLIETKEELESLEKVDAIAKVKLVLTPDFIRRVSNLLKRNIDKYEERFLEDGKE